LQHLSSNYNCHYVKLLYAVITVVPVIVNVTPTTAVVAHVVVRSVMAAAIRILKFNCAYMLRQSYSSRLAL
jgi:hypothetical protein